MHAKGIEHQSDDAANCLTMFKMAKSMTRFNPKIAETLAAYGQTWESVDAILNSILKDISNYGIEGRANQTDDLTLAISHQPSSN